MNVKINLHLKNTYHSVSLAAVNLELVLGMINIGGPQDKIVLLVSLFHLPMGIRMFK